MNKEQSLSMSNKALPKSKTKIAKLRKGAGGGNIGQKRKTSGPKEGPFCGTKPGSFPTTNPKQARSALAYSKNDPKPGKVKACVYRIAKKKGWFTKPSGKK